MTRYPVLRVLAAILKVIAALVLLATILVVLAIGGGITSPPGLPSRVIWLFTLGAAVLVALAGLLATLLLYTAGEIIALLLVIDRHLRSAASRLPAPSEPEQRSAADQRMRDGER